MLSVLVTDFLQFIVMSFGLIAVTILILTQVGWEQSGPTVSTTHYARRRLQSVVNAEAGMAVRHLSTPC